MGSKPIKDYFRSFFCQLICLQLIFFLAQFRFLPMKRNEASYLKAIKKKVKSNENRIRNGKQNKGKCVNRANDSIFSFWAKGVPATDD